MTTKETARRQTRSFVGGAVGGILGLGVSYPLDSVKVHLQTKTDLQVNLRSTFQYVREQGFFKIYRGVLAPCIGGGMIKATAFGSKHFLTEYLHLSLFTSSFGAGAMACIVVTPVERIKILMQSTSKRVFTNSLSCAIHMIRNHGALALFRGFNATLLRDTPGYGIYFYSYEIIKSFLVPERNQSSHILRSIGIMLSGGISGVVCWIAVYPFDIAKSRIQAEYGVTAASRASTWRILRQAFSHEGLSGLSRGMPFALSRAFLNHCVVFLAYESFVLYTNS
eukprot:TRINITY_DN8043_c0_g1_i1.p1 TRINITY_DN8043_c0_g1~~TRINITY_DN8043_c0_g1_i1.p1  ORF type:complete len:280 (-),score=10.64 TRINITY_DN8043_c0_g1_i1:461-1300(-)